MVIFFYLYIMQRTYRVLLTPEAEGGFSVSVPALPGCFTQGETIEEAVEMAREAISLYVESLHLDVETGLIKY